MPDVIVYVPQHLLTEGLAEELVVAIKATVASHMDVPMSQNDVWPYIIGAVGCEDVTVKWCAHNIPATLPGRGVGGARPQINNRTEAWVTNRSGVLAYKIGGVLEEHGFPEGTNICVDGSLLPYDKLTAFVTL